MFLHLLIHYSVLVSFSFQHVNCWGRKSQKGSQLSTFRTEALNIKNPVGCNSTFEEAAWIMRSYFIFKNRYSSDDWSSLTEKYRNYKDSNAVSENDLCFCTPGH